MIVGVTMGDSSGVGPEILLKAFRDKRIPQDIVVFGDLAVLAYCNKELGYGIGLRKAAGPGDIKPGELNVIDLGRLTVSDLSIGAISAVSGAAARAYVVAATEAALAGEITAFATLPMNKEATRLTDSTFTGHTELVGSLCGVHEAVLMLVSDQLIVTHISSHMSLREAIGRVKQDRVQRIIQLTCEAVRKLRHNPRIAVAGLNPHAGENGLFGAEDVEEIAPAVAWAKNQGLPVEGPVPPDTVFYLAVARKCFDAVVCMYHDQGHIPMKLLDFEGGVNTRRGIPVIRTSVDHGTAFDIAWTGKASVRSFVNAVDMAVRLSAEVKP